MLSGIFVFIGLQIGYVLTFLVVTPLLFLFERPIQWREKSYDEWRELGVSCPGERLPVVSFVFGVLHQTISELLLYLACLWILKYIGIYPSIIPFSFYAILSLAHSIHRTLRFMGSTGQPKVIGYFFGTIIAFIIFLILRFKTM